MSKRSDIKLLKEIEDVLYSEMFDLYTYAGTAFLTNDEESMNQLKGQYLALNRVRKKVEERYLRLMSRKGKER